MESILVAIHHDYPGRKISVTIAISSVQDAFGVRYAREMALAVLAGFPVAAAYLVFQKKVTNALMMTSGIKG